MKTALIGLATGAIAGALDILPMCIAHQTRRDIVSAAIHWIVLGLVLAHLATPLPKWVEGMLVALLTALPVVILVAARDRGAVVPMLACSAVLGGLSGLALGAVLS